MLKNPISPLIQNIDTIPSPDYNYGVGYYILEDGIIKIMEADHYKKYFSSYRTIAVRGCPYACTYCCNNTLNKLYSGNKIIRKRSPENVIDELIRIKKRFPFINRIEFNDDAFFTYTINEMISMFEIYTEMVQLPFTIFAGQPKAINKEKIELCVDAGLDKVRIGIQSASKKTQKLFKRSCSNDDIKNVINLIHDYKDMIEPIRIDVILDNPWEDESDIIKTLMFLSKLPKPYYLYIYSLTFYPETELCKLAKKQGLIQDELNDVYRKYYLGINNGYLNNIFKMLNNIYPWGGCIYPWQMYILTNKTCRCLKINFLIWWLLKLKVFLLRIQWLQKIKRKILFDNTRYFKR